MAREFGEIVGRGRHTWLVRFGAAKLERQSHGPEPEGLP
jgi:hypothetical protein